MAKSDFPDVDWADEDVGRLIEIFSEKFDVMAKKKDGIIDRQSEEIKQLKKENEQLKKEIKKLASKRSRASRSYNARKFKDYPRPAASKRQRPEDVDYADMHTIRKTADLKRCPECGEPLSESAVSYDRTTEDAIDGRWIRVEWEVIRRYCKKCGRQYSAAPDGVLPGEHFGVTVMSQACVMRCLAIPHEKIGRIIHMLHGRFIEVSNVIHMCDTVADELEPLYKEMLGRLAEAAIISGDDTGWFLNKLHWWAWVFITSDMAVFHLSSSRSKLVAEAILEGFEGIMIGDSHSSWNDVAPEVQRCLLHYFRDMYLTLKKNDGPEFKSLFNKLHAILKDAIAAWIACGEKGSEVPASTVRNLQRRIDRMADGAYEDEDCKRYAKRLRRERGQLLTFLKHDGIPYHNNLSERVLRIFALMRKVCYGSRSIRGIKTTEILTTIYATCELRGTNPYTFLTEYLSGRIKSMPAPKNMRAVPVAAA